MIAAPYSATMVTVRTFNTTGAVVAADHYCIPPQERICQLSPVSWDRGLTYGMCQQTPLRRPERPQVDAISGDEIESDL